MTQEADRLHMGQSRVPDKEKKAAARTEPPDKKARNAAGVPGLLGYCGMASAAAMRPRVHGNRRDKSKSGAGMKPRAGPAFISLDAADGFCLPRAGSRCFRRLLRVYGRDESAPKNGRAAYRLILRRSRVMVPLTARLTSRMASDTMAAFSSCICASN